MNGEPTAPNQVTAAAGSASAAVTWSAPLHGGGTSITGYTVTGSPGGQTCSWWTGPLACTVEGLANGTTYTFTVTANGAHGVSVASEPSNAVTQMAVPDPPTALNATPGNATTAVSWSAPFDGGSPITSYTVTASPGGQTCTWSTGPLACAVSGLVNGTTYTFSIVAASVNGPSPPSNSMSATPRTVPDAPTDLVVVSANAAATVSWAAPAFNGGTPITGYTVHAQPGDISCRGRAGRCRAW